MEHEAEAARRQRERGGHGRDLFFEDRLETYTPQSSELESHGSLAVLFPGLQSHPEVERAQLQSGERGLRLEARDLRRPGGEGSTVVLREVRPHPVL